VTELLIVDMTLDNERVAEFFEQFGFWVADAVVTSAGCVFSLQSQNLPLKVNNMRCFAYDFSVLIFFEKN
jgi:hypothetical protein